MAVSRVPIPIRPILALAVLWSSGSSLVAQQLQTEPLLTLSGGAGEQDPPAVYPDRLEVKLAEGCGAEWRDGRLHSRVGADLSTVQQCFADAAVEPLVRTVSWDRLDEWHRRACEGLPEHRQPGHLGLWFRLRAGDAAAVESLRARLDALPLVEHVYLEPRYYPSGAGMPLPTGGDLPPTTPSFTGAQLTHGPTPDGHGVRAAAGMLGARGRGVGFRMIEDSWILGHEDMCQLVAASFLGPVPAIVPGVANHGLSGSSIVTADRNAYGITGIANEVDEKYLSINLNGGLANAMALAMANSQPGDVVLIVEAVLVPALGPGSWLPIEFIQSTFDTILTATQNGLIVVLPAGNGNRGLDDPALLGRFDRNFRDSGSIIVAATAGVALTRILFSNWGTRIDANSWGAEVVSCGYGSLFFPNNDPLQAYSDVSTGTSSSTPHIAGIVAALQGAARRQLGQPLTNSTILDLLHNHGPTTPDIIGRRPDLVAMLQALGAFDGLSVDEPDLLPGATITVTMEGPAVSVVGLFGSFGTADIPLGFNRNVHMDLASLSSLGAFVITGSPAQLQLPVPNNASLHDVDIYFQAVRLTGTQPLFLTNSCQVTIL